VVGATVVAAAAVLAVIVEAAIAASLNAGPGEPGRERAQEKTAQIGVSVVPTTAVGSTVPVGRTCRAPPWSGVA